MSDPYMSRRAVLTAALSLFAVVWFGNIEFRKLIKPDEGRYAEVPREMVATSDWLTPRLGHGHRVLGVRASSLDRAPVERADRTARHLRDLAYRQAAFW